MNAKKILVVSHAADGTAQFLIKRLEEIGQPYHLLDLGLFPQKSSASLDYTDGLKGLFSDESGSFALDEVKSVWWRRPKGKIRSVTQDPVQRYIETESEVFVNGLCLLLPDVKWVSHPEKTRTANNKPLQLAIARQLGLRIPATLISNDPNAVKQFIELSGNRPLIMKPVGTSFVRISTDTEAITSENLAIFTKIIDKKQILENLSLVQNCPVIFQEAVMQAFDIRVTVVGSSVFAVKITHTTKTDPGDRNLDWRNHKLDRIYQPYDLSPTVADQCIRLTKTLGLTMGALDFCFSEEKGLVFLEINPQGQWVPSEVLAGLPISMTLAKFLAE